MKNRTYLSWYKERMKVIFTPKALSLMSSCVPEPLDLLAEHHPTMSIEPFAIRFHTPNPYGHPGLISRISERYSVPENRILLTQGATSALYLIACTLLEPGDHVLVERPGYEPLWHSPASCGARIGFLPRPHGRLLSDEEIVRCLEPETRLIMMTNLHNPTGFHLSRDEIKRFVDTCRRVAPEVKIVMDEIYLDFKPDREASTYDLDDCVIAVSSLTKVYGFSLLRCGWIFGEPSILKRLRERQVLVSGIGSRYLETVSTLVFDHLDTYRDRAFQQVNENKGILNRHLQPLLEMGVLEGEIPQYGCVTFLRVPGIQDTETLTDFLESRYDLYCVPGRFFGAPDCIRIGFGETSPEKLDTALRCLKDGLAIFQSPGQ